MMALEEMTELSMELLKNINRKKSNESEIKDEIADVYIMLEQLKIMYDISEQELIELMENKLERLKRRFNKV
jgi:NTP pyrophosphatase (non-canonical NTP hydrolase)